MTAAEQINPSDLVPSVSIEHMAQCRAAMMERIEQMIGLEAEIRELAIAGNIGMPVLGLVNKYRQHGMPMHERRADFREACRVKIDSGAWKYLMNQSGLRTFLDRKAREEWDRQIYEGKVPELTPENIAATFSTIHAQRGDLFERGVLEVFKSLSWDYKTNSPCKFGKRIVYGYFASAITGRYPFNPVRSNGADAVDDLVRVFCVLDGKPEPDHRGGTMMEADKAHQAGLSIIEHEYYRLKWFKNGNAHIEFKRADLVAKMNAILAKHHPGALPPRL